MELEHCPFCGGEAGIEQTNYGICDNESVKLEFTLKCKNCGATSSLSTGYIALNLSQNGELNIWHDDRERIARSWNKRTN